MFVRKRVRSIPKGGRANPVYCEGKIFPRLIPHPLR